MKQVLKNSPLLTQTSAVDLSNRPCRNAGTSRPGLKNKNRRMELFVLAFLSLLIAPAKGQTTGTAPAITYRNNILLHAKGLSGKKIVKTEEITVAKPFPGPDTTAFRAKKEEYPKYKEIRVDPEAILEILPDACFKDGEGAGHVDYNSLVSLLLDAVIEQNLVIEELNKRLGTIEKTKNK